jgi:hypothetical protein
MEVPQALLFDIVVFSCVVLGVCSVFFILAFGLVSFYFVLILGLFCSLNFFLVLTALPQNII